VQKPKSVARFAKQHDLIVIADEAYEDWSMKAKPFRLPRSRDMFERDDYLVYFLKSYAMTGWRLGYVVAKEPWMTGLRKTTLYSSNGVSTPTQWAGLAAFNFSAEIMEQTRVAYQQRRDLLLAGLNELGLNCEPPAGRVLCFPEVARD